MNHTFFNKATPSANSEISGNQLPLDPFRLPEADLQPEWKTFFSSFTKLGAEEIQNRQQDIQRLLRENGVTYNIYGDTHGKRQWNLDLIPFIIGKQEWEHMERGLVQRAELLNLILQDIYGERKLVRQGILPMELVYNHRGFLRQCDGMMLRPRKHSLVLYSANMARSSDGRTWIISDRTQAPSGSGYALENRSAFARIMPELFNGLKVGKLSPYFDALTNALTRISPQRQQFPRVVVLTPGPSNETYFEHSYLASYLGFTLVQGNDLMVKDNFVWLKTLGGLERVDVIMRRVDDIYCDPLELKEDSQLGVPGLVQAIRSGNVALANPLGSGILESPGLMPFLQNISRHFLGEDLIIPNIATWWCGQQKEMNYVLQNLQRLVIKKIYRESVGSSSIDGQSLSQQEIDQLKEKIKAQPFLYVGQERIHFSKTPTLLDGKIEPRNALFRSFLVSNVDTYTTMVGGLTRTSDTDEDFLISGQLGGASKDTWVLAPDTDIQHQPQPRRQYARNIRAIQDSGILPSHTAENLFWVGRYTERFLGNSRFLRTVMQYVAEGNRLEYDNDVQTETMLLQALTHYSFTYPGFLEKNAERLLRNPWPELRSILMNENRQGSLYYNFNLFDRAVYSVRDHWSTDTWRVLRTMEEEWQAVAKNNSSNHIRLLAILDGFITSIMAFIGLNRESIYREQGWIMLDMGRKIEQCMLMISMLRSTLVHIKEDQVEYNIMEAVLRSHESLVNYRSKYKAHLQLSLVLDLLLFDNTNPRSLVFQMERLNKYAANLPKSSSDNKLSGHERLLFEALSLLKLSDKNELSEPNVPSGQYKKLDKLLEKLYGILVSVPVMISKTYFKHAEEQKQLFIAENI
jgi:uncharacterized circularly permuted ATP-grasp superfamily protein/uncharacterized alpha-E superfamily protein